MELLRAKVKATGEEIIVAKKETENELFETVDNRVFKKDELDFSENLFGGGAPSVEPVLPDFNPAEYLNRVMDMQKDNFWRDQRVEFVKILLQRETNFTSTDMVNYAEELIQRLKAFGN